MHMCTFAHICVKCVYTLHSYYTNYINLITLYNKIQLITYIFMQLIIFLMPNLHYLSFISIMLIKVVASPLSRKNDGVLLSSYFTKSTMCILECVPLSNRNDN